MTLNQAAVAVSQPLLKQLRDHIAAVQGLTPTPAILSVVEESLMGLFEGWIKVKQPSMSHLTNRYYVQAVQTLEGKIGYTLSPRLKDFVEGRLNDKRQTPAEAEEAQTEKVRLAAMSYNERIYAGDIRSFITDIGPEDVRWLSNRAARLYQRIPESHYYKFRIMRLRDSPHFSATKYAATKLWGNYNARSEEVTNPLTGNSFKLGFLYIDND